MKNAIVRGLMALLIAVSISGCGNKTEFDFSIENHDWHFSNMVSTEDGVIVACCADMAESHPEADVMELSCKASTNIMAIRDRETGNGKEISYSGIGKDTNSLTYKLAYREGDKTVEGMAVSSITEYAKGEYEYTLVIDIGGYALYFVEKAE